MVDGSATQGERAVWLATDMVVGARFELLRTNRRFQVERAPRYAREDQKLFWQMYEFFFEDHPTDGRNPLSFASVCDGCGIDVQAARDALRRDLGPVLVPPLRSVNGKSR